MKYLIGSDIHGSAFWCQKFMDVYTQEKPDEIILLGDILYHGPRNDLPRDYAPKKVIAMLNPLAEKINCCRGNCEAEVDQMVLDFECMGDYNLILDDDACIFCTHGHIFNPDAMPNLDPGSIFLYGHTHVKDDRIQDGIHIFNPGSVSIPKDGSHSCAILDDDGLRHIILSQQNI